MASPETVLPYEQEGYFAPVIPRLQLSSLPGREPLPLHYASLARRFRLLSAQGYVPFDFGCLWMTEVEEKAWDPGVLLGEALPAFP